MSSSTVFNASFIVIFCIATVFCCWKFLWPLWLIKNDIIKLSISLKNYTNDNIMYSYETLDTQLSQNPLAAEAWGKYKKNLARSKDEDMVRIYSTVEAEDYFNIQAFTGALYTHFYSGMAGVFTGIGILGTFVGLTIGLLGIDTSSTAALQGGISVLLSGMTTAFWTSVVGIGFGLIFNIVYSIILKRTTTAVQTVASHFERIFLNGSSQGGLWKKFSWSSLRKRRHRLPS